MRMGVKTLVVIANIVILRFVYRARIMTKRRVNSMECETCPVRYYCEAYTEAERDNDTSYHPQAVVRVYEFSCPLRKIVQRKVSK